MSSSQAIIIGGGIAGIATALALTKLNNISCTVYELRTEPTTIGGAINLIPPALRYLEALDVLPRVLPLGCIIPSIEIMSQRTGGKLGVINFANRKGPPHGLRVMRSHLLSALLEEFEESGGLVEYGKKLGSIFESEDGIEAIFEDGASAKGDVLIGCDGIHSAVRTTFVEPARKPVYSGIAVAYGLCDAAGIKGQLQFEATGLHSGRWGSLLTAFCDAEKTRLFLAAVMETKDVGSRGGWKVRGEDQEVLREDILRRFSGPSIPYLKDMVAGVDEWVLYPVYHLPNDGSWRKGRVLLLGDSAHAMPPQGESVGIILENVMLFSRLVSQNRNQICTVIFQTFEEMRKPRVNAAFKEASFRWETAKDSGWLVGVIKEWFTWLYLSCIGWRKQEEFAVDVRDIELPQKV